VLQTGEPKHLALCIKTFLPNSKAIKMRANMFCMKTLNSQIPVIFHCDLAILLLSYQMQFIIHVTFMILKEEYSVLLNHQNYRQLSLDFFTGTGG
jgi:hypothetical protein